MSKAAQAVTDRRPSVVDQLERWLEGKKFSVYLTANFSLALLRHARERFGQSMDSGLSYRLDYLRLKAMFASMQTATFNDIFYFSSFRPQEGNSPPPEMKILNLLEKNGFKVKLREMTLGEREGRVKKISPRFTVALTTSVRERIASGDDAVVILDTNRDVGDQVESLATDNKRVVVGDISGLKAFVPHELGKHAHFKFDMSHVDLLDWLKLESRDEGEIQRAYKRSEKPGSACPRNGNPVSQFPKCSALGTAEG